MSASRHPISVAFGLVLLSAMACSLAGAGDTADIVPLPTIARPSPLPTSAPSTPAGPAEAADVVFYNGGLLTMDAEHPSASAIRVQGEKIISVGDDAAILAEAGPQTQIVDLGGLTLMPGFVDAHSHMFGDVPAEPDYTEVQDTLLRYGVTTTTDMWIDESDLLRLMDVDGRAGLRLRLNVYLGYNTACGEPVGDWYRAYAPTRNPGERLRISGIKVFADGGSCNVPAVTFDYPGGYGRGDLYFNSAAELEPVIRELDGAGWQVAIHAIGDRALDVVLRAYANVLGGVNPRRHRIEHNSVLRPDQLPLYSEAGAVATIFGPFQTCITLGDRSRFRYLVPPTHQTWEWPWRDLLDANPTAHFAWHGDMPGVFTTDVFQHLYGFVTRNQVSEDGSICRAPDWLARNAITVDEALRLMTIDAAYALDRDAEVGSLEPGKFADLILLSANPRAIPAEQLKDLQVWMTMVGGKVEYCAEGMEALCPSAPPPPATAPPAGFREEFDGSLDPGWTWLREDPTAWSLAAAPGWLRLNLSTGGFFGDVPAANLLVRPAPTGDFALETSLRFTPRRNFEFAGLIVVFADDSVLQFGRAFCDAGPCVGDGFYFDNIQAGAQRGGNLAAPGLGEAEGLLRLVRTGNTYTAYLREDPSSWMEIGSHTVDRVPASVGLLAAQAPAAGTFAEFDYFEMTVP